MGLSVIQVFGMQILELSNVYKMISTTTISYYMEFINLLAKN